MQHSMLGLIFLTLLAAGCGGADQNSGSGGTGGETTTSSTTGTGGEAGANPTGGAGGMTNTGGSTGGANTGGSMGGTNTGGSTGGAGGCQLLTEDASKIGASCENGVACPTGYTCHEFNGIAVTHTCAILCDQDCQCPQGTLCTMRSDKATSWKECVQP